LAHDVETLQAAKPVKQPWWSVPAIAVIVTLLGAYVGVVHQAALGNRTEMQRIAATQYERSWIGQAMRDVQARTGIVEQLAQQLPPRIGSLDARLGSLEGSLRDMHQKLDRLIERGIDRRLAPREELR
jgi:hypothetical protein